MSHRVLETRDGLGFGGEFECICKEIVGFGLLNRVIPGIALAIESIRLKGNEKAMPFVDDISRRPFIVTAIVRKTIMLQVGSRHWTAIGFPKHEQTRARCSPGESPELRLGSGTDWIAKTQRD